MADVGASHCQDYTTATKLVVAAKTAGADAVKFQAYTPDTVSVDSDHPAYTLTKGPWAGWRLHDLYTKTFMPLEWHKELFVLARDLGLIPFSTPSCPADIDYLETLDCPAYKIASHDIVYLELIAYAASTGKPVILSTGMATFTEILDAVACVAYREDTAILHCTSAYPTPSSDANIDTLTDLQEEFIGTVYGLSDHTKGTLAAICAVAAGACIIEKHIGFEHIRETSHDGGFYANPEQFKRMVEAIREAETVMGEVKYGPTSTEFRRRLCWAKDLPAGHTITRDDILTVCGAEGLLADKLDGVVGRTPPLPVHRHTPVTDESFSVSPLALMRRVYECDYGATP